MTRTVHEFRDPNRFVVGTIGEPGDRAFYVQARSELRTISVGVEKQQASVLAERMGALLNEVAIKVDPSIPPPTVEVADLDPLDTPVDAEFRVGTMGLGWDTESMHVVVELMAIDEHNGPVPGEEDLVLSDADEGPDALRVFLTPSQARQFVSRTESVVAAGRTLCPLCSELMGSSTHVCVRLNGFTPRDGEALQTLLQS